MLTLRPLAWPLAVGLLALAATFGLWSHEVQTQDRHLRDSFATAVREAAARIQQRLSSYEQMLRGTRGLFESSDEVSRADFAHYVDALLTGADATGLRTVAWVPQVAGDALEAHVAMQRSTGLPDYTVRPPGMRPSFAPVTYVAPTAVDPPPSPGFDLLSEPARRAAMERSRDSGQLAISSRVHFASDASDRGTPGFVMFLPLYDRSRLRDDDVEARRAALQGWVVASFRMPDLMASLHGAGTPGLELRMHDGDGVDADSLVYPPVGERVSPAAARFTMRLPIVHGGHTWTLAVHSLPEFEQRYGSDSALIIGIGGIAVSLLLSLLTWQLVTGRDRAHAEARLMSQQARDSAERYRRIVDTANEGIWTLDRHGRTDFVNPKLSQLLGHAPADMAGRPLADFMEAGAAAAFAAACAGEPGAAAALPRELCLRRRDGSELWAAVSASPIAAADGRGGGLLAMVTDVTERRLSEANRTLLEVQLRQSQKMEAIGTLAGGIAHDFNNILAAILGNVALARQELGHDHGAARPLEQIAQAGTRARSLVQQIVAFSRREPQALVAQPLRPLVEESLALLRSTLPAPVALETRLTEAPLSVAADATQLQQVLMNLCTNAWHAMPQGQGRIVVGLDAVTLDAARARSLGGGVAAGPHAHLWVQDDGSGMDDEVRSHLFEPFFTTKPVGQGTGLGLAVVHGIVLSHRGAISVDSEPGRGSTFHLYFPLASAGPARAAAPPPAPADSSRGDGRRLLYVDDDEVMRVMVQALLQRAGWSVSSSGEPAGVVEQVATADPPFDAVVTDYNMPGLSGLALARELQQRWPGLPVVMTSGYVSDALHAEAALAGVRAVLQKEYTLEQLGTTLQQVLQQPA